MDLDLTPQCEFSLITQSPNLLLAGVRNPAVVRVMASQAIPRAQRLEVRFASVASASFEGREGGTYTETRSLAGLTFRMNLDGLAQGNYEIPLVLDLPPWIPPTAMLPRCEISHSIHFDLDVDWALDVERTARVWVVGAPFAAPVAATPLAFRVGGAPGQDIALEVTLASTTVADGDVLHGTIALRSGHHTRATAVNLAVVQLADILFGPLLNGSRSDRAIVNAISIPIDALRSGYPVEFRIAMDRPAVSHRSSVLNLSTRLEVSVPGMSGMASTLVRLSVVPRGTTVVGASTASLGPIGLPRMQSISEDVATHTGLQRGKWPDIAHGREGMVDVVVADQSRGVEIVAVEHHRFPGLRLGLATRSQGALLRDATLAPPLLAESWTVEANGSEKALSEAVLREFVAKVLIGYSPLYVDLSDDQLTLWHRLSRDDASEWSTIAIAARARARAIDAAIRALPFPDESQREAWTRAAADESAALLPHLPMLAFVRRVARTRAGEERCALFAIAGRPQTNETRVSVAFDVPVPHAALHALAQKDSAGPNALLLPAYSTIRVDSAQHLTATAPGIPADPRPLLDTLQTFLEWALRVRGEQPVVAPYR